MTERLREVNIDSRLRFMYNKITIPRIMLDEWMTIPEFTDTMLRMVSNSELIDNSTVLPVMEVIYADLKTERFSGKKRNRGYGLLRRSIKKLSQYIAEDQAKREVAGDNRE